MKKILFVFIVTLFVVAMLSFGYGFKKYRDELHASEMASLTADEKKKSVWARGKGNSSDFEKTLAEAFENQASNLQIEGAGVVTRILADDTDGSRHQRFIVTLRSGQTLLMAHNIDLAPRIDGIAEGDRIEFNGEYEWNDKGGVIHWTHHDPERRHEAGWIRHEGRTYQ